MIEPRLRSSPALRSRESHFAYLPYPNERRERASLLDEPQRLGFLPTAWYWRRVDGTRAAGAIMLLTGIAAGLLGGALASHAIVGLPIALLTEIVLVGFVERRIRSVLRSRRRR